MRAKPKAAKPCITKISFPFSPTPVQAMDKTKHIDCDVDAITQHLIAQNISFISSKNWRCCSKKTFSDVKLLIQPALSIEEFNRNLIAMLELLAADFSETGRNSEAHLEQEFLDVLLGNFRRLTGVLEQYPHFSDIYAYRQLLRRWLVMPRRPLLASLSVVCRWWGAQKHARLISIIWFW